METRRRALMANGARGAKEPFRWKRVGLETTWELWNGSLKKEDDLCLCNGAGSAATFRVADPRRKMLWTRARGTAP